MAVGIDVVVESTNFFCRILDDKLRSVSRDIHLEAADKKLAHLLAFTTNQGGKGLKMLQI